LNDEFVRLLNCGSGARPGAGRLSGANIACTAPGWISTPSKATLAFSNYQRSKLLVLELFDPASRFHDMNQPFSITNKVKDSKFVKVSILRIKKTKQAFAKIINNEKLKN
jgi:hypothetical protein